MAGGKRRCYNYSSEAKAGALPPEIRKRIGAALGVEDSRVSVKAKTSNGLGFEGARDGVSAQAVALIESDS